MITVTSAQLEGWIAALLWPLARILALLGAAPVLGQTRIPARLRVGLGIAIAVAIAPVMPPPPQVPIGSAAGLLLLATQIVIGVAMGLALRLVFAAVEMAGDLIGMQMGLGFALMYDPVNAQQTPVLGRFLGVLASLVFLSLNGHLLVISTLADSFRLLPISVEPLPGSLFGILAQHGAIIFGAALRLAFPLLVTLLIVNMALGALTRAAPQLNIFAVGFPITLGLGFCALIVILPYFAPVLERMLDDSFRFVGTLPAR